MGLASRRWSCGGRSRRRRAVNRFGRWAWAVWAAEAPGALSRLVDPETFFGELGEQAEAAWVDLTRELMGPDLPGEGFLGKVGRIEAAKLQARELVDEQWCRPPRETSPDR